MPWFLRQVDKSRWLSKDMEPYLSKGDIPADPLKNLGTLKNKLSVWQIDDGLSNLGRIAAALIASRKPKSFDYILFKPDILDDVGIRAKQSQGSTGDKEANVQFHYDLLGLSGFLLIDLVQTIVKSDFKLDDLIPDEVLECIWKSFQDDNLKKKSINPNTFVQIGKLLGSSKGESK